MQIRQVVERLDSDVIKVIVAFDFISRLSLSPDFVLSNISVNTQWD